MYDFANSGYTTVVLTTIFNAYFVGVVVGRASGFPEGIGTLLWTVAVSIPNALVLVSAPVLGAIADHYAAKKRFLLITTIGCVLGTASLALAGPGDVLLAMALVVLSNLTFATGENLAASSRNQRWAPWPSVAWLGCRISRGRRSWGVSYVSGPASRIRRPACPRDHADCRWHVCAGSHADVLVAAGASRPRARKSRRAFPTIGFQRLRHTPADSTRFRDHFAS
jgi:hypothetical protein